MRLTAPFFIVGSLMEAVAPSIPIIAIGRFLSGVGAGASIVVGPIYISEVSPSGSRGLFGALTQIGTNLGILGSQVLGYFLSYESMWRVVLGVAGGIGAIQFLCLMLVVESPEWLGTNGHEDAARKTLIKIRGNNLGEEEANKWRATGDGEGTSNKSWRALLLSSTDNNPQDEQQGLLGSTPATRNPSKPHIGILAVARHPDHYKAIIAVVAVMLAQQLCGINSVIMYSVSFLSDLLPTTAGLITVAVGALNLVVTVACSPLSDRLGRKVCLLLSIAGMGINSLLLALGILFEVKVLTGIVTLLFVASFAVGLGPVPFILASELVDAEAVGATQSWALGANWIATFLVAQFFPIVNDTLPKGRVFFIFAVLAAVFFGFISWWVPESRGRKDADEVWGRERRDRRED